MVFSSVVFPAPFGPSSAVTDAAGTVRLTPRRTVVCPYPPETPRSSRAGGAAVARSQGLFGLGRGHGRRPRGRPPARSGWRPRRGIALEDEHAEVEHVDVRADAHDERHVVLDEQDAAAPLVDDALQHVAERAVSSRSSPDDGSSSSRRSNGPARQRASSTSRRWPVDSAPAWTPARSVIPQSSSASSAATDRARWSARLATSWDSGRAPGLAGLAAERDVVEHGQRVAQLHDLERAAEAEAAARRRGRRRRRPRRGGGSVPTTAGSARCRR